MTRGCQVRRDRASGRDDDSVSIPRGMAVAGRPTMGYLPPKSDENRFLKETVRERFVQLNLVLFSV